MSSTTPLRIPALIELANEHYDIAILSLIQFDLMVQSMEMRALNGEDIVEDQVMRDAESMLPKGFALQQLYFQRVASISRAPIEEIESIANTLAVCAKNLERTAARVSLRPMTVGERAKAEDVIAQRYAQIIRATRTIEERGVISIHHSERLERLLARPIGPLSSFFDKAMALVTAQQPPRARMAA